MAWCCQYRVLDWRGPWVVQVRVCQPHASICTSYQICTCRGSSSSSILLWLVCASRVACCGWWCHGRVVSSCSYRSGVSSFAIQGAYQCVVSGTRGRRALCGCSVSTIGPPVSPCTGSHLRGGSGRSGRTCWGTSKRLSRGLSSRTEGTYVGFVRHWCVLWVVVLFG